MSSRLRELEAAVDDLLEACDCGDQDAMDCAEANLRALRMGAKPLYLLGEEPPNTRSVFSVGMEPLTVPFGGAMLGVVVWNLALMAAAPELQAQKTTQIASLIPALLGFWGGFRINLLRNGAQ